MDSTAKTGRASAPFMATALRRLHARPAIMLSLLMVITACSFKTLYNNLDTLIVEYIEERITLDDVTRKELDNSLTTLLHWHRNSQLKQYANWIRALQQDAGLQLTEKKLAQRIDEAGQFWLTLSLKLNDEMAQLLVLLNHSQQLELYVSLAEANEEFREEHIDIDDEKRLEKYHDEIYETSEKWLGTLSSRQEKLIEQAAQSLLSTAELRLQQRLNWQQGIQQIMQQDDNAAQKRQKLQQFFSGFDDQTDALMKQRSAYNREVLITLTVRLAHSMTKQQREFFISRTDEYIRQFTELAEAR